MLKIEIKGLKNGDETKSTKPNSKNRRPMGSDLYPIFGFALVKIFEQ